MSQNELLLRIFLTIIFGAVLGLETETRQIEVKGQKEAKASERSRLGGFRTYTILSLLGGISGIMFSENLKVFTYIIFAGIVLLILSAYILNVQAKKAFGLTTEIAILITYILGFLTTSDLVPLEINLVILVLLSFFLSQKRGFGYFLQKIQHKEVIDITKFGLVSLVVLPILPNQTYTIASTLEAFNLTLNGVSDKVGDFALINPFQIWLIVVLISGLDLFGYLLSKFIGAKKGLYTAGFLGGLVSSTSTTVTLANISKKSKSEKEGWLLAGASLASNSASYIDTSLILIAVSATLFREMVPFFLTMFVFGIILSLIFTKLGGSYGSSSEIIKYEPFSIKPAVNFVLFFLIIKFLIQGLQLLELGKNSILFSAITGVIGFDPVVLAMADVYKAESVSLNMIILTLLLANGINLLAKSIYAYTLGSKSYFRFLTLGLLVVAISSLLVFVV